MELTRRARRGLAGGVLALACAAAALRLAAGPGAVCRQQDMTAVPDDWSFLPQAQAAGTGEEKWAALTFDDGPSCNTEAILDILKEEQVPATFFVVAAENNEPWLPLLGRIQEEGHQIGLHSCTHDYSQVYASTTDFWADIKALKERLAPYVADPEALTWLRFIGGSTNTVSHRYGGSQIMSRLKVQAAERGYRTIDWNVSAEDAAGGHPDAEEVLANVRRTAEDKDVCVVLMHDTKATGSTVEALPAVIAWFRENGYRFCTVEALPD